MRTLFFLLCLGFVTNLSAHSVNNGGDTYSSEVISRGLYVYYELLKDPKQKILTNKELTSLLNAVRTTNVEFVDGVVKDNGNFERLAIYLKPDPKVKDSVGTIRFSLPRWKKSIGDKLDLVRLVGHEYFRVIQVDDENYSKTLDFNFREFDFQKKGSIYLFQEYVEAQSLGTKTRGKLDPKSGILAVAKFDEFNGGLPIFTLHVAIMRDGFVWGSRLRVDKMPFLVGTVEEKNIQKIQKEIDAGKGNGSLETEVVELKEYLKKNSVKAFWQVKAVRSEKWKGKSGDEEDAFTQDIYRLYNGEKLIPTAEVDAPITVSLMGGFIRLAVEEPVPK